MGVNPRAARWGSPGTWLPLALVLALAVVGCQPAAAAPAPDLSAYPWLYLRAGRPLAPGETLVEIIAVGDIMPGRGVPLDPDPFGLAAPWLGAADLALGNFEGVLADFTERSRANPGNLDTGPFPLLIPPAAVPLARGGGLDLLGLANNHALDRGPSGLAETAAQIASSGLQPFGAGPDPGARWAPVLREVQGIRLAFLACNAVPFGWESSQSWAPAQCELNQAVAAVEAARRRADAVIVLVHWGYEYDQHPDPTQQALGAALIAAGADLVLGHHPHTIQGTEVFRQGGSELESRDGFVAYSLGNFVFDQPDVRAQEGLAVRAFFDRDGLRAVQALPVFAGPQPRLTGAGEAAGRVGALRPPPRLDRFACDPAGCRPSLDPGEPQAGIFWSGEIDLSGDGQPEQVRRVGRRVIVLENGKPVWQSPAEWEVLDAALGDPNDDGRGEILLALLKPDSLGVVRSHPFIIGYRGGQYRQIWGGSAVSSPIREVELGDVDGDGVQELIVLEEQGEAGAAALSVWRWHGWGFSLVWRSEGAAYRNLALRNGQAGQPIMIQVEREYAY